MAAYIPNPQDPTQPTTAALAGNMAAEFQALKGYIQSLVASGTNFAYIGGFRNRLNNGAFNIYQRGASVTIASNNSGYTADQWIVGSNGAATTAIIQKGNISNTANNILLSPAAGNTLLTLTQRIESTNCQDLIVGTPVTVSGLYWVGSLSAGLPNISLASPTAQDNWASNIVVGASTAMVINPQIANTWQFFKQTFTLTSDATNGLEVVFTWPSGAPSQSIGFGRVQLEKGSSYTQFEQRPIQQDVAMCQRHYQIGSATMYGYTLAGNSVGGGVPFPVVMRTVPTITYTILANTNITSPIVQTGAGYPTAGVTLLGTGTATGGYVLSMSYTASAEL